MTVTKRKKETADMTTLNLVVAHAKRYHDAAIAQDLKLALTPQQLNAQFGNASFVHPDFRPFKPEWISVAKTGELPTKRVEISDEEIPF